ncbi:hypothetical protein DRO58_08000 [Candidatus Bathyarchaeota archaeon]|nr:MAG: hypothetical protein DRO58_08000 [Candidatus Bathyarchaeota archaeon]
MGNPVEERVRRVLKTLDLAGVTVHIYVERFENAYLVLISENGVRLGTLVCSIRLREGLTRSMTLLGWKGEIQARMLAEKIAHETGLITLLSINLEEENLQKNLQEIAKALTGCLEEVKG